MCRSGYEYISSFEKAIEVEEARYNSPNFRNKCNSGNLVKYTFVYNYMYFRSGLYAEQIERYLSYFDRSQFKVINFSDFAEKPYETVADLYKFLLVDNDFIPNLSIRNKGSCTTRIPVLQHIIETRLGWLPKTIRRPIKHIISTKNSINIQKIDPGTRDKLMRRFDDDQNNLLKLVGFRF